VAMETAVAEGESTSTAKQGASPPYIPAP
jgi:hypothetical protein